LKQERAPHNDAPCCVRVANLTLGRTGADGINFRSLFIIVIVASMIVGLQRHIWRRRMESRELAVHYFRYGRALLRGRARYIGERIPLPALRSVNRN
jgi:hypothetical protein